ncbi:MAG: hypothetical protein AAGI38_02245 [Bacteroidota bacterium]
MLPDAQAPIGSLSQILKTALRRKNGLRQIPARKNWGPTLELQVENATRELCIRFLGRILLLKALEGKLVQYHNDATYQFLNPEVLRNWRGYDLLFFEVMNSPYEQRSPFLRASYGYVPPLNIPIFQPSQLEMKLGWGNLYADKRTLPIMTGSVLHQEGELPLPLYIAEWLQAYQFGETSAPTKKILTPDEVGWVLGQLGMSNREVMSLPISAYQKCVRPLLANKVIEKVNQYFPEDESLTTSGEEALQDLAPAEATKVLQQLQMVIPCVGQGVLHRAIIREWARLVVNAGLLSTGAKGPAIKRVSWQDGNVSLEGRRRKKVNYSLVAGPGGLNRKAEPFVQACFERLFELIKALTTHNLMSVAFNEAEAILGRTQIWLELMSVMPFTEKSGLEALPTFPTLTDSLLIGDALEFHLRLDQDLEQLLPDQSLRQQLYRSSLKRYHHAEEEGAREEAYTMLQELNEKFHPVDQVLVKKKRKIEHELQMALNPLFETPDSPAKIAQLEHQLKAIQWTLKNTKPNSGCIEWRTDFPAFLHTASGNWKGMDLVFMHAPMEEAFEHPQKDFYRYRRHFTLAQQKEAVPTSALYLELCIRLRQQKRSNMWVMLPEHHFTPVERLGKKSLFPVSLKATDWNSLDKEGVQWEWKIIQIINLHDHEARIHPEKPCSTA